MSTLAPLTIYQQLAFEQILLPPVAIADTTWSAIFSVWNGTTGLMTGSAVVLADRSVRLRLSQGQTSLVTGKYVYYLDMKSADRSRSFDFRGIANVTLPAPSQPPQVEPGSVPAWLTDVVSGAIANHNINLAAHPGLATGGGGGRIVVPFSWGDASPKAIATVTGVVVTSSIVVMTGINSVSQLRLGDTAVNDRLMSASQNLPSEPGEYETNPGHNYVTATPVSLTISLGTGTTQGGGFVILEVI